MAGAAAADRRTRPGLPRRRRRPAAPRHRRRAASRWHGHALGGGLAAAVARELPVDPRPGALARANVGRRRPRGPGGRRRRRVRRRGAARRRRSDRARTRSGSRCSPSAPGRRGSTAPTSPSRPTPVHPGPARSRRRRPLGDRSRVRRPVRAGDADGRARGSSSGPTPSSATTRGSGPSSASAWPPTRAGRPRSTGPTAWRPRPSWPTRARLAHGAATDGRAACRRPSASTSSARTWPTPARTRSTTRWARRS